MGTVKCDYCNKEIDENSALQYSNGTFCDDACVDLYIA